jgi:uncharacterized OB-fold protein
MNDVGTIVVNPDAAGADATFVAPDLVRLDSAGKPQLKGGRCRSCGALSFPRASVCPSCLSEEIEAAPFSDEGNLYSYSIVHQAPKGWATPYILGYVDLDNGIRVLAHIDVAPDATAIDMRLKLGVGVVGADPTGAPLMSYTFTRP